MESHHRQPIGHTCPSIDAIIAELEKLRTSNEELREWGIEEARRVDSMEDNSKYEAKLKKEIRQQKEKIMALELRIKELENER